MAGKRKKQEIMITHSPIEKEELSELFHRFKVETFNALLKQEILPEKRTAVVQLLADEGYIATK